MKELYIDYHGDYHGAKEMNSPQNRHMVKIVQAFGEDGEFEINGKTYPLTFSGMYFIDSDKAYQPLPDNLNRYSQNMVMVDKNLFENLATSLGFEKEYETLFIQDGGNYLPLADYKEVDKMFQEIYQIYQKQNPYGKALTVAKMLNLLSYGVYGKVYENGN